MNIYISKQHPSFYTNLPNTIVDRTPYTYLIGWSKLNKWYYGRRTGKNCHPREFWTNYHTSSVEVNKFIRENGNPDIIQIRQIFTNIQFCKKTESRVLRHFKVSKNDSWLNKKEGDDKWDTTNCIPPIWTDSMKIKNQNAAYLRALKKYNIHSFDAAYTLIKPYIDRNATFKEIMESLNVTKSLIKFLFPITTTIDYINKILENKKIKLKRPKSAAHRKNLSIAAKKDWENASPERKEKHRKMASVNSKLKKWVTNGIINHDTRNYNYYLQQGWRFGCAFDPNRKQIQRKITDKRIMLKFKTIDEFNKKILELNKMGYSINKISEIVDISFYLIKKRLNELLS